MYFEHGSLQVVMGIALVWLFIRALNESEAAQQRRERFEAVSGAPGA